ncbi:MAG: hypothetical protein A4E73_03665 [Syntrophaceae bacterium PtaU1.Bin231]|nr:MAG: hypothetical protein A4E73_03665 [Syntrophaceae bacterium PtaU1.Bin231]
MAFWNAFVTAAEGRLKAMNVAVSPSGSGMARNRMPGTPLRAPLTAALFFLCSPMIVSSLRSCASPRAPWSSFMRKLKPRMNRPSMALVTAGLWSWP